MRPTILAQATTACAILALAATAARADTIFLKNGDRITGKIVTADAGKVTITPDFDTSAKITIAQSDIATFASTTPVVLKLKDGTMLNQKIEQGAPGQVRTAAGGAIAPQPVQLADVAKINLTYDNRPPAGSRQLTSQFLLGVGLSY